MISTIEIYRAIRERLESEFPNILVQQKDIKNITRPSFYIQYVGKAFDRQAQEYWEDRISFNIIYFSQKEELLELLEIEETFTRSFKTPFLIKDNTKVIELREDGLTTNINEEDYYLNMTVDFVLMQHMAEDDIGFDMQAVGVSVENADEKEVEYYETEDDTNDNMEDIE